MANSKVKSFTIVAGRDGMRIVQDGAKPAVCSLGVVFASKRGQTSKMGNKMGKQRIDGNSLPQTYCNDAQTHTRR